ncbi:noncanonical pyrimidine nucleotidase, YjjG family [Paludibacter sp. 221]|uniref:YjjG family noncanonical pyrimidine nucleotidase n=1 Tax=Paludibacter sp. 221 TaxID=2302939 RepID=UPI0013D16B7C|nr:YjjG family noncanonical pyrimidine nucleotidase [Paludibacter sp. 221]NDV46386.1 noncanonical pyrimidine nucleotidase, YjjG family [Paludibacter sp. 221]
MYKHVFLDLDDTIWDFHANAKKSLNITYDSLSLSSYFDCFEEFFDVYIQRNNELWDLYGAGEISKDFLQKERFRYPLSKAGIEDENLVRELGEMYLSLLPERTILVPHARELLDYLSQKYTLTIISNGFIEVQYRKLKNSGIDHYFKHVVLSEDAGALKPDRKIFDYALNLNNAKAEEAIMIGDIYQADIQGAQNAGIDQIFFNWRGVELSDGQSATHIVDMLEKVYMIL